MTIKSGGFSRKSGAESEIPTSSMADIAFLLLIFFMVTTVFRKEQKRTIEWVDAEATQKIDEKRKNIVHIWVEQNSDIYINDQLIALNDVAAIIRPLYAENRELVVALRGDREVPYQRINGITEQLQGAGAVRVTFATRLEQRMLRPRR